ncbi:MAG TPA: sensor domain-containing diguanylate cyclase [Candidatus Competibacteraceae bacterium]|nr:sensor domain-containing diguanylate cyclase [Candidatus Competibacteraceae bacterium]
MTIIACFSPRILLALALIGCQGLAIGTRAEAASQPGAPLPASIWAKVQELVSGQIANVAIPFIILLVLMITLLLIQANIRLRQEVARTKAAKAALTDSENRLRSLFERHSAMMLQIDADTGKILEVNHAAEVFHGLPRERMIGLPLGDITALSREDFRRIWLLAIRGQQNTFVVPHRLASGEIRIVEVHTAAVEMDGHRVLFAIIHDVTDRVEAEMQLVQQASQDPLTELPNRRLLMDRLKVALSRLGREGGAVGLLFMDLDGFKAVNDRLGHDAGDALLKQVATRLRAALRESDTVARLGGDEFAMLVAGRTTEAALIGLAGKLIGVVTEPYRIDDESVSVTASIGIAMAPDDERDAEALLTLADQAMYAAKRQGKNRAVRWAPGL